MVSDNDDKDGASVLQYLKVWASNSVCNGIPNIERSAHIVRKVTWILLVLAGTGTDL